MNMKPGKPTTFITIDKVVNGETCRKLVFALPGNPVSASVCTELLVRPCLDLLHSCIDIDSFQNIDSFVLWASENAIVHEEVMATLSSDVKLDKGRPEYHRVSLQRMPRATPLQTSISNIKHEYIYQATTTGVQRSSCVLSLRNADGLMMLPRGGPLGCGYDVAARGMSFPVLLFSSLSKTSVSKPRFKDCMHRKMTMVGSEHVTNDQAIKLGLILCTESSETQHDSLISKICNIVTESIGTDCQVKISNLATVIFDNDSSSIKQLSSIVNGPTMKDVQAILVIVSTEGASGFRKGLEVAHTLHPMILKNANALALQIRNAAASQDPLAALFENMVGTVREGSAVLMTFSDLGLDSAIRSISSSLRHLVSSQSVYSNLRLQFSYLFHTPFLLLLLSIFYSLLL